MYCLERLVGLKNVCDDIDYDVYIDDLPMLDIQLLASSASAKDVTGKDFFKRCRRLAAQEIERDIVFKNTSVEVGKVIESTMVGGQLSETIADGLEFQAQFEYASNDPYITNRLDSVSFYSTEECCDQVLIVKSDGVDLEVKFNSVVGWNTVPLQVKGQSLTVVLANSCMKLMELKTNNCFVSCEAASVTYLRDGEKDYSSPLRLGISSICDTESIICNLSKSLKYAMRWKTAACILEDILVSRRSNPIINASKDHAKDMLAMIMGGADSEGDEIKREESKYWPELWAVQRSLKNKNTLCLKCRGPKVLSMI